METTSKYLLADTVNGVQEFNNLVKAVLNSVNVVDNDIIYSNQDFYESLSSLKDGEAVISEFKKGCPIYQKIENEYGIH